MEDLDPIDSKAFQLFDLNNQPSIVENLMHPADSMNNHCDPVHILQLTKIKTSHRQYRESLAKLRLTLQELKAKLASKHAERTSLISSHITFLQRELGSVDLKKFFTEEELVDLTAYVNANPYLKSLLEKRNESLLKNLLSYSNQPSDTPEPNELSRSSALQDETSLFSPLKDDALRLNATSSGSSPDSNRASDTSDSGCGSQSGNCDNRTL